MQKTFDFPADPDRNLLPRDGCVNDYGRLFSDRHADRLFAALMAQTEWRHDEIVLCSRRITASRQTAWYGEPGLAYTYSGITRRALPWNSVLLEIKQAVEARIAARSPAAFNSCLLNLYQNGTQGMAWHSDDEPELGPRPVIASLSLGAARKFAFKHRTGGEKTALMLEHGQLIVMHGTTQRYWLHALMKTARESRPRINLTFRVILPEGGTT